MPLSHFHDSTNAICLSIIYQDNEPRSLSLLRMEIEKIAGIYCMSPVNTE